MRKKDEWENVKNEFATDEKVPDELLLWNYVYEDYSGSALLIYRNGEKYYWLTGGHCSCSGLEGQFEPEEFESLNLFVEFLKRIEEEKYSYYHCKDDLKRITKKLKTRLKKQQTEKKI